MSVRFLGRRVYLGLAVVLVLARHAEATAAVARLAGTLAVPLRTIGRWRKWRCGQFALTPLWQAAGALFMPPVNAVRLPASLLECFAGAAAEPLMRLLIFLTPLTVGPAIRLREGC